jgi:hypothetical protein
LCCIHYPTLHKILKTTEFWRIALLPSSGKRQNREAHSYLRTQKIEGWITNVIFIVLVLLVSEVFEREKQKQCIEGLATIKIVDIPYHN